MRHALPPRTALADPIVAPCANRFDLLVPVRALRKTLGLVPNDLAVLTALVSFLPREGATVLSVVFPSNAALSERANGLDERTLRRCLARLITVGLIERKSSANGKRFPLRHRGVIRDAFGFDLRPLIDRQAELRVQGARAADEAEHLRALRAEAQALRASLSRRSDLGTDAQAILAAVHTRLRRASLTVNAILSLIEELRSLDGIVTVTPAEPPATTSADTLSDSTPLTGRNGQNVRHKEPCEKEIRKQAMDTAIRSPALLSRDPKTMDWKDFRHVAGFFPSPPQSPEALTRILTDIGSLLRIGQDRLTRGLRQLGAGRVLLVLDYLIAKAGTIREPGAYFAAMLARDPAGVPS